MEDRARRDRLVVLGVALGLALLVRLPTLFTDPLWGTTEQHEFGLYPAHLVHGLLGPSEVYLPQRHQGCTILFGVGCWPVMAALGTTVGATRVCSILLHVLLSGVIALLALRARGREAGLAAAALAGVGTPALLHFATKGSTNHDDATLFVGGALLAVAAARGGSRRQAALGALAGLLGGLAIVYYLDALFAVVGVAAAALLGAGRGPRLLGFAAGFGLGYLAGLPFGVDLWGSGAVQVAVEDGALSNGLLATVSERLGLLWDSGLEEALGPWRSFEWGPISFHPERWGTAAYVGGLLLMTACGIPGLAGTDLGARRVLLGAAVATAVGFAAVVGSGVDITYGGYTTPLWTYLVVLAAAGWPRREAAPWVRGAWAMGLAAALLPALPGALEPVEVALAGDVSAEETRVARSLRVDRIADHAITGRSLLWEDAEVLEAWLEPRPRDRGALARVLGKQVGLHLHHASWRPETWPDLPPRLLRWWGQGVGEGVVLRLQRAVRDGPGVDKVPSILDGIDGFSWPPEPFPVGSREADVVEGLLLDLLHYASGRLEECEVVLERPALRRDGCVAAGRWAYLGRRQDELARWNDERGLCRDVELGVGFGLEMAREVDWTAPPPARLSWLWPEATPEAEAGFQCGYQRELTRVQGVRGADWRAAPADDVPCL